MTEEVFLNQIRILSLHMIFPIWISGFCILLRVGMLIMKFFLNLIVSLFIVQIEPSDDIPFSVISSSTQVIVIPEYREQSIVQPEQTSIHPSDTHIEPPNSFKNLVRSVGTLICSSFPNVSILTEKKSFEKQSISKLALVPGRHRRLYRVEIDETTSINPTIARINRSDWSSDDDDGTSWPNIFVAKVTVYRSSKEVK